MSLTAIDGSSFRDPSGFVFRRDGGIYRQVNLCYREEYDDLLSSGLYQALVDSGLLISHREVSRELAPVAECVYKVIEPELVPLISYPYEWSFSQLKDAALTTLQIQRLAMSFGFALKDCSAYNVQFVGGRPVHIDTLSFERYQEGQPWAAYRQFCQHFLAPLALMALVDVRLGQLLRVHIDGIPLDLASHLLPFRSQLKLPLLLHIHLHARAQSRYADSAVPLKTQTRMQHTALLGLVDSLRSGVNGLTWRPDGSEWADYNATCSYSAKATDDKRRLVSDFLDKIAPPAKTIWDLGANTGVFSRIAASKGMHTVSVDLDPAAVERSYLACKEERIDGVLPLVVDLTNPSPDLGWANEERLSFLRRGPADGVLALALIHHLAVSNNLPLDRIAGLLHNVGRWLIVEFVPKHDPQVQKLLASRADIFPHYAQQGFEKAFNHQFIQHCSEPVGDTGRTLYLMERRA